MPRKSTNALAAATQPDARLASTTISPPSSAPTVGMKASRPAWMPRMNELGMPMIARPIEVTRKTEKQHDKEVSDGAHRPQQQFKGLADDGAAARGERACAGKIACRCRAGRRRRI